GRTSQAVASRRPAQPRADHRRRPRGRGSRRGGRVLGAGGPCGRRGLRDPAPPLLLPIRPAAGGLPRRRRAAVPARRGARRAAAGPASPDPVARRADRSHRRDPRSGRVPGGTGRPGVDRVDAERLLRRPARRWRRPAVLGHRGRWHPARRHRRRPARPGQRRLPRQGGRRARRQPPVHPRPARHHRATARPRPV
ncbi:MAG: Transcriptional regulator, AcrR family, partial [uncultured Quadrisphaera sp.]